MELSAVLNLDNLFAIGTIFLAICLIFAGVLHIKNISNVHKLMKILQKKNVEKSHLYKEMTVSQGINFTALAFVSWIMLFVAIAFQYLLVPTVFPFSYMEVSELASNPMGFFIFGILVALLVAVVIFLLDKLPDDRREFRLTELYSFYLISKDTKRIIGLTPIALYCSVFLSAYLGTIYPGQSIAAQLISLVLILASAGILVMPIYKEAWEARI
ncbi:MAG: hypothetical protein LUO89_03635 [Methanothrix sp.]|nr:hypothetical protein [Methanothrix sp.]